MGTTTSHGNSTPVTTAAPNFFDRHYFLLRRLHSLTGIVPIGVFLINHLLTNSSILWGRAALKEHVDGNWTDGGIAYFWREVKWLNEQIPHLLLIEITLWASIFFHAALGVYYARSGKANTSRYAYQGNRRYQLQRLSGYFGIFFIFYHVATLRWGWTFLVPGGTEWTAQFASSTLAACLRGGWDHLTIAGACVSLFYMLAVGLLVFHFANGLWTAAITWGLTVSVPAQRRWGYICTCLGAALLAMGWGSVIGYAMLDPGRTQSVEQSMEGPRSLSQTTLTDPIHPLAEPGYPWPGTEDVVRKEAREGPLEQGFPIHTPGGGR